VIGIDLDLLSDPRPSVAGSSLNQLLKQDKEIRKFADEVT